MLVSGRLCHGGRGTGLDEALVSAPRQFHIVQSARLQLCSHLICKLTRFCKAVFELYGGVVLALPEGPYLPLHSRLSVVEAMERGTERVQCCIRSRVHLDWRCKQLVSLSGPAACRDRWGSGGAQVNKVAILLSSSKALWLCF